MEALPNSSGIMRAVIMGVVNKEMAAESQLPIENFKKSRIINFFAYIIARFYVQTDSLFSIPFIKRKRDEEIRSVWQKDGNHLLIQQEFVFLFDGLIQWMVKLLSN
jgi:hypothetical protein